LIAEATIVERIAEMRLAACARANKSPKDVFHWCRPQVAYPQKRGRPKCRGTYPHPLTKDRGVIGRLIIPRLQPEPRLFLFVSFGTNSGATRTAMSQRAPCNHRKGC